MAGHRHRRELVYNANTPDEAKQKLKEACDRNGVARYDVHTMSRIRRSEGSPTEYRYIFDVTLHYRV